MFQELSLAFSLKSFFKFCFSLIVSDVMQITHMEPCHAIRMFVKILSLMTSVDLYINVSSKNEKNGIYF